ncbi:type VII secretion protein EccB [Saccharopolyspora sp. CA-218241]|uniref:type VII secretion protein EccB n=1 Tax=Saccharopolyspora sp. CA-218241 TaxID=3240027 RepID=UPI003D978C78
MQTQRDHVHAYQFLMNRMSSALVLGDPASAEVPAKRAKTGLIIGLVLTVLIGVGFGVYGIFVPGGNEKWKAQGAIVVEKETGTRYANVGGVLHPTLNYASAKLLQGPGSTVESISRASLEGAPRGAPIGIPGAPQTLPPAEALVGSRWLVCLPSAGADGAVNLDFDPAAASVAMPAGTYLPVRSVDGTQYLLWQGRKHRMADPSVAVALGMANARPATAPQWWLDVVPEGPVLQAAPVEGAGTTEVGGTAHPVGQLFEQPVPGAEPQRFVLLPDGLAPLNRTEFALQAVRPGAADPVVLDAAAVAAAPRSADRSLLDRLPDLGGARPHVGGDALCLRQAPAGDRVRSEVVLAPPRQASAPGGTVHVPPGSGLVVGAVPLPAGQRVPDRYFITDQGTKHLMPDDESIRSLGLGSAAVRPISNELLATLPTGPVLSRAAVGAGGKVS